jgi:hypothetical protein
MKRSSRFVIGLAAAALTFGSLFAFVGPKNFNGCDRQPSHWQNHDKRNCGDSKDTLQVPADRQDSRGAF